MPGSADACKAPTRAVKPPPSDMPELLAQFSEAWQLSLPSLQNTLLYLLLAFVLSTPLAWVYIYTHQGVSYSRSNARSTTSCPPPCRVPSKQKLVDWLVPPQRLFYVAVWASKASPAIIAVTPASAVRANCGHDMVCAKTPVPARGGRQPATSEWVDFRPW